MERQRNLHYESDAGGLELAFTELSKAKREHYQELLRAETHKADTLRADSRPYFEHAAQ
jgi:hypothetical protein